MKLSKNGITTLKRQYRSVLLKCLAINAGVFMLAMPAMAEDLVVNDNQNITDIKRFDYGQIVVNQGAELTIENSDLKTTAKPASTEDVVIKGKINLINSVLEAGNDEESAPKNSNMLIENAIVSAIDSDIEANGNITITGNTIMTLTTDDDYGVWAAKDLTIIGGNITLNGSYLSADGNLNINGSTLAMADADIDSEGGLILENSNLTLEKEVDIWVGPGSDGQYGTKSNNLEINNSKITYKNQNNDSTYYSAGFILENSADLNIKGNSEVNLDLSNVFDGEYNGIIHAGKEGHINISDGTLNLIGRAAKIERGKYLATSEGNINISGGTLNLKDGARISTTAKNTGDINISGSAKLDLSESEIRGIGGNINVKGGTIKLSSKNDEAGHQNMSGLNPQGYVQTGNNLGLVSAKNINISGGEIILDGESIDAMGDINFTGGTINETGSESDATLWAGGNINLNGGTINVQDYLDVNTFYHKLQDEKFVPVDADKGLITIDGATINLAKDAWMDLESTNKVNFKSGTINVVDEAGFSVYNTLKEDIVPDEHGIYHEGFCNEDVLGTLYAEKDSVINLAGGELDANYVGNGQINITGPKAYLNGNVNMTDGGVMNIDANQALADGDVTFAKGSTLKMAITDTANGQLKANKITAKEGSTLSLTISKTMQRDESADFKLFDAESIDNHFTNLAQNNRYEISTKDGAIYNVIYKASASDIVDEAGGTANNAATAEAWDQLMNATGVSEVTKAIVNLLNELSQLYPQAYTAALTALAPETAPAVQQAASETAGAVFSAVGSRLSGGSVASSNQGMSSGDALDDVAIWAQGMFNHARLTGSKKSSGFHSDTWGTAFGIEKKLNPAVKVGVGYAYSKTDIKGFMRKTDVKTHTALVYGEYKPSNWYANAVMSYGWSDYEENKNVAGINVKSKYDVEAFGLQAMTGYDIYASAFKLTPEAGLRYVYVKQDTYTDSSGQRIKSRNSDTLTGVLGAKVSKSYTTGNGIVLTPELKAAMTYDISHDNSRSTVTLVNGSVYNVSGKPLNRFGVELGAGLTAEINDKIELSAGYEGKFRKNYQDHTGLVSAKYNF